MSFLRIAIRQFARSNSTVATAGKSISGDVSLLPFSSLGGKINESLLKNLEKLSYSKMTPVQAKTIVPILENSDGIVARARTGTGKTLAFGIPILHDMIEKKLPGVGSLIIAPTRDLANQIADELTKVLGRKYDRRIVRLLGGESRFLQKKELNRSGLSQIAVGTPGRIKDFLQDESVSYQFANVRYKVLDEADRLLDIGFSEDLAEIDQLLKSVRSNDAPGLRTTLFSATIDNSVLNFAKEELGKNYLYVDTVDPNEPETHEKIHQSVVISPNLFDDYIAAIHEIFKISQESVYKVIVFMPTVKSVTFFRNLLSQYIYHASEKKNKNTMVIELHGKMSQGGRDKAVARFKGSKPMILITTNVGARGMDFPKISHVVQVGLPSEVSDYIHRIGRTARGDSESGKSILFVTEAESKGLSVLKKRKIEFKDSYKFEDIVEDPEKVKGIIKTITEDPDSLCDRKSRASFEGNLPSIIEDIYLSLLGASVQLLSAYKLRKNELLPSVSEFYKQFSGSDNKPAVPKFLRQGGFSAEQLEEYFSGNTRSGGSRGFGGKTRGGYRGRDDGGYRGRDDGGYRGRDDGGYGGSRNSYGNRNRNSYGRDDNGRNGYRKDNQGSRSSYGSRSNSFRDRDSSRKSNSEFDGSDW